MKRSMNRWLLISLGALGATSLLGCTSAEIADRAPAAGEDPADDGEAVPGLAERLAGPTSFAVLGQNSGGSRVQLTAVSLSDDETASVELTVTGGALTLSLDQTDGVERIRFHDLVLDCDDVAVSPAMVPPDGLVLTDLTMDLGEPASAELGWRTGDAIEADAALSVDVKWAVEVESSAVDLAPIRMPSLAFAVTVEDDRDGQLVAHLGASNAGRFWSWAGIFELRDLELDLVAVATSNP